MAEGITNQFFNSGQAGTGMMASQVFGERAVESESIGGIIVDQYLNPAKPGRTWKNWQVGSMALNYMRGDVWKNLSSGKGLEWRGVIGLRGLFAGQQGFQSKFARFNPLTQGTRGLIRGVRGAEAEARFIKGGLFGSGGMLDKKGKGTGGLISKFVGGANPIGLTIESDFRNVLKSGGLSGASADRMIGGTARQKYVDALNKIKSSKVESFKVLFYPGEAHRRGKVPLVHQRKRMTEQLAKNIAKGHSITTTSLKRASAIRLASSVGKFANFALWLPLAFTAASAATQGLVNLGGSLAERIESGISNLGNKKLEFGGQLEPGFLTSRSSTERQRALQAIHQSGFQGRGLIGNEATNQHVGNTW